MNEFGDTKMYEEIAIPLVVIPSILMMIPVTSRDRIRFGVLKHQQPQRLIIAAVPVAPLDTCERLRAEVDEMVCLITPKHFSGIGQWYENFTQTTDEEVCELLTRSELLQN
jgi:predicted phosphoribosyltransferase